MNFFKPAKLIVLLSLLLTATVTSAQQWYHVEIIVFQRLSGAYAETWPEMADIRQGSLTPDMATAHIQPAENESLNDVAERLENASDYQVLYHQAWQQPILYKNSAEAVKINSDDGMLEGMLLLSELTYVSADIDLWLKENIAPLDSWTDENEFAATPVSNPHLYEIRRVKSNELIYFDHPRIAAIIELTPVETPVAAISETPETYSLPPTNQ